MKHVSNSDLEGFTRTLESLVGVMPPNVIATTALEWINSNLPCAEQQWIKQFLAATRFQSIPLLLGSGYYIASGDISEQRCELLYFLSLRLMDDRDFGWLLEVYQKNQLQIPD